MDVSCLFILPSEPSRSCWCYSIRQERYRFVDEDVGIDTKEQRHEENPLCSRRETELYEGGACT